jgi:hypothetical protein
VKTVIGGNHAGAVVYLPYGGIICHVVADEELGKRPGSRLRGKKLL